MAGRGADTALSEEQALPQDQSHLLEDSAFQMICRSVSGPALWEMGFPRSRHSTANRRINRLECVGRGRL